MGWKDKEFSLGYVKAQVAMGHPIRKVRQTAGVVGQVGGGKIWSGEVELLWVSSV